ncbi:MAG: hypothetical protein WAS33_24060 [Candidatus Promineifilaceae bacterium]|nr:hypothetical protein [Anaerolineaceae bacterium]
MKTVGRIANPTNIYTGDTKKRLSRFAAQPFSVVGGDDDKWMMPTTG